MHRPSHHPQMCTATVIYGLSLTLCSGRRKSILPFLTPSAPSPLTINVVRGWGLKAKSLESGAMSRGSHFPGKLCSWELAWRGKVRMLGHPQSKVAVWKVGVTELKSLLSPNQGTTVRVITAVDQDKGRPRGIGYTIVSGKPKSAVFVPHPERATADGGSGSKSRGVHGMAFQTCLSSYSPCKGRERT